MPEMHAPFAHGHPHMMHPQQHHHHPQQHAPLHGGDLVSEFEQFHLEAQQREQQKDFERAYAQSAAMPPHAMAAAIHHQQQQHHHAQMMHQAPPEMWASEFQQQQQQHHHAMAAAQHARAHLAPEAEYEQVYQEVVKGPAHAPTDSASWASQFEADEQEDLDNYFRQADDDVKTDALEEAYSEAAQQTRDAAGLGVDKSAIDRLMATADPKMRNSQFMKFLSKVSTGEIQFRGNQAVEASPAVASAAASSSSAWADMYAGAPQASGMKGEWVDDYASAEEIHAAQAATAAASSSDQWAAEYEEQRAWEKEYEDAAGGDGDEPEWMEQYKQFDWTGQMQRAMQDANEQLVQPDPVYQFAVDNPYTEHADALAEAMQLFEAGNLSEAVLAFEAVLQKTPEDADCWRLLGQCHAENEEEAAAIAALLKAVEFDPYNLEALLLLSVSFTNDLEQSRALNFLKAWLQHHPDYQSIHLDDEVKQFEEMYGGGGDQASAHQLVTHLFMRASQAIPNDADVLVALGVLYNISSEYDKAVVTFQRAVELRPTDASIWNKLGATQANSERSADALGAYKRALDLRPNYVRALANLGIAYANQNMHHEAAETYLSTLARNPKAEHVWSYLRLSLASMGRDDLVQLAHMKDLAAFRPAGFRF
jgi:peroxin-5